MTTGKANSDSPLWASVKEYIARHGLHAFMDEDYNLTGTRVRAVVTEDNVQLAQGFGLPLPHGELPVALEKSTILESIDGPRNDAKRAELARSFCDTLNLPQLSLGQRMFLE